jgi:MFS family permease
MLSLDYELAAGCRYELKVQNLLFLYSMELCAGLARGSYLVCIGWITLIVSGDVAVVGKVFTVAMLTNILVGPIVGITVDRYNSKHSTIVAHFGIAISLVSLGSGLAANKDLSVLHFLY